MALGCHLSLWSIVGITCRIIGWTDVIAPYMGQVYGGPCEKCWNLQGAPTTLAPLCSQKTERQMSQQPEAKRRAESASRTTIRSAADVQVLTRKPHQHGSRYGSLSSQRVRRHSFPQLLPAHMQIDRRRIQPTMTEQQLDRDQVCLSTPQQQRGERMPKGMHADAGPGNAREAQKLLPDDL